MFDILCVRLAESVQKLEKSAIIQKAVVAFLHLPTIAHSPLKFENSILKIHVT